MDYWLAVVAVFSVSLILALSCYVVILCGELSFGQQAFFGVGAYAAAVCTAILGTTLATAILAAVVAAAATAWLVGWAALRAHGFQFTIFTVIFAELVRESFEKVSWQVIRNGRAVGPDGPLGFSGIDYFYEHAIGPAAQAVLLGSAAVVCVAAVGALRASRLGQAIEAAASDATLAAASGLDPQAVKRKAFVLAGALAGMGGGLFAHYVTYVDADNFSLMLGIHAVAYTLIGGMGSVAGPVLGTALDIVALEWLRLFGGYRMVVFGSVLVLMMIVRPQGLIGRPSRPGVPSRACGAGCGG